MEKVSSQKSTASLSQKLSEKEVEKFEEKMLMRDKQVVDDIYNSLARLKISREGEL